MKKQKSYHENKLYSYLQTNGINLIAYQCTRLTGYEIDEIKTNGLNDGEKDLLYKKTKTYILTSAGLLALAVARVQVFF